MGDNRNRKINVKSNSIKPTNLNQPMRNYNTVSGAKVGGYNNTTKSLNNADLSWKYILNSVDASGNENQNKSNSPSQTENKKEDEDVDEEGSSNEDEAMSIEDAMELSSKQTAKIESSTSPTKRWFPLCCQDLNKPPFYTYNLHIFPPPCCLMKEIHLPNCCTYFKYDNNELKGGVDEDYV